MIKHNQDGAVNGLAISLMLVVFFLLCSLGFGAWAYSSQQDYKKNTDVKIAAAVEVAKQKESTVKDAQFAEESKQPLKNYSGPEAYGSVSVYIPKNWSGYIDDSGRGNFLLDGYFAAGFVPSLNAVSSVYALRVTVENQPYAQELQALAGLVQGGKLAISAYALPKVPKTVGVKAVGQLANQTNVNMVVLPLRSQTLKIWTEGSQYVDDFNKNVLPNFSFSP